MKPTQIGNIIEADTLILRQDVGTLDKESGETAYELSTTMGTLCPIIRSKVTGKWFTLGWDDIRELAIAAGIDE